MREKSQNRGSVQESIEDHIGRISRIWFFIKREWINSNIFKEMNQEMSLELKKSKGFADQKCKGKEKKTYIKTHECRTLSINLRFKKLPERGKEGEKAKTRLHNSNVDSELNFLKSSSAG